MLKDKLKNKLKLVTLLDNFTFIDRENCTEITPIRYSDEYKPLSVLIYYDGKVEYYMNDITNNLNDSAKINMTELLNLQNLVNLLTKD